MDQCSCALIVIGNEILSGKIQDTNAYFTARALREIGVALDRIVVVPDEVDLIAVEVRACAQRFTFVLTSGGVGPTHDDVTVAGVAKAFGREVVRSAPLERLIRRHMADRFGSAALKMAEVPQGAVLNDAGEVFFPVIQVENVYLLPGIPQLFEAKLTALKGRFATDPFYLRAIYSSASESAIADHLNRCVERFPKLLLGSYPRIGDQEYRVKLTLESKDPAYLDEAFNYLMQLLPRDAIVKIE